MSAVPPDSIASALQSALQQGRANQIRTADDRRQADISQAIARAAEQRENQIEDTDADTRVHSDGSGGGGQGRPFSESEGQSSGTEAEHQTPGITTDEDGQMHVDLTA